MRFFSTRDLARERPATLSQALGAGLAADGGLFVPESLPRFDPADYDGLETLPDIAERLLRPFFEGDALQPYLTEICTEAFNFPVELKPVAEGAEVLELFHGPTAAFKDFGARFLALCLGKLRREGDRSALVLVATSGDTGAAVAAAFHRQPGFGVRILYPDGLVSARQAHGLECWGENIEAFRVAGTFDDCQHLVKTALSDRQLRESMSLLSANSISLGRWLPQACYYAFAALRNLRSHGEPLRLIVPTGNLGNAMAALLLKATGWPIEEVALACNANQVLPDYFETAAYQPAPAKPTIANAMDVGAPSNFERLLWLFPEAHAEGQLRARSYDDGRIRSTLVDWHRRRHYLPCPHTACAFAMLGDLRAGGDDRRWTICATAHPAKFEAIVEPLLGEQIEVPPTIAAMLERAATGTPLTTDYAELVAALLRNQ